MKNSLLILIILMAGCRIRTEPVYQKSNCPDLNIEGSYFCGSIEVPENRADPDGKKIPIHFMVLESLDSNSTNDPVLFFAGGPGQAATESFFLFTGHPLREAYDIILIDQRGTGQSNGLDCVPKKVDNLQDNLASGFNNDKYRICLEELQSHTDLNQYTTEKGLPDFYDVLQALGVAKVNIISGSYGTRVAQAFLDEYPEIIRTVVLNGVASMNNTLPLNHSDGAQVALEQLIEMCEADQDCYNSYPDLRIRVNDIIERFRANNDTLAVVVNDPLDSGRRKEVLLTYYNFSEALRTLLYFNGGHAQVPKFITQVYQEDYTSVVEQYVQIFKARYQFLSQGMMMCITCSEDLPRIEIDRIEDWISSEHFYDRTRMDEQAGICEFWPNAEVDPDFFQLDPDTPPVLMLSGQVDPVTPGFWADTLDNYYTNSQHMVLPGGHYVNTTCAREVVLRFIDQGYLPVSQECKEEEQWPDFVLE